MVRVRAELWHHIRTRVANWPRFAGALWGLSLAFAFPARAEEGDLRGVWRGTLGGQRIVACFNGHVAHYPNGNYFYVRHLRPITLQYDEKKDRWREFTTSGETGFWNVAAPWGDRLVATWHDPAGHSTARVELSRFAGVGDDRACATDAYNEPIEHPRIEVGAAEDFDGHSFRRVRFGPEETAELLAAGPAIARINAELRKNLPTSADALREQFERRRTMHGDFGGPGDDETHTEPAYWADEFVTVRSYRWVAGTGRNGIGWTLRTWDLRTGKPVRIAVWVDGTPVDQFVRLPRRVRDYLVRFAGPKSKEFEGCDLSEELPGLWQLELAKDGLRFEYWETGGHECSPTITVPYDRLTPILTSSGKAAVERLHRPGSAPGDHADER